MTAGRGIDNRIARCLAILTMVGMMTPVANADEIGVSLPRIGSDPVVLHLAEGASGAANPSDLLEVFVGAADPCCEGRMPMAGRYARTGDALAFSPAFGFEAGQDYLARVGAGQKDRALVPFRIPVAAAQRPAAVTEIYPSGATLPENVLRFYIHFSVPMTPHVAFDYIRLRDASGTADDAAFMRFKQELWNEDRTRLTVLIDPGRIKRNVATNRELGPALRAGHDYTLSVDPGWPSADGSSILPGFSKRFRVTDALRERPDVALWQVASPCRATRDNLEIAFDRAFDRHLLDRSIRLVAGNGQGVDGRGRVGDDERSWTFTPDAPWGGDDLTVLVDFDLEDVAGNNFRDLLDHLGSDAAGEASPRARQIDLRTCPA